MQLIPGGSDLKTVAPSLSFDIYFSLFFFYVFLHLHTLLIVRAALSGGGFAAVEPRRLADRCPLVKCSHMATEREASWGNCRILPGYFPRSLGTAKENQSSEENPNWHFGLVHTCMGIDLEPFFRVDLTCAFIFFPLSLQPSLFSCTCKPSGVVMWMIMLEAAMQDLRTQRHVRKGTLKVSTENKSSWVSCEK